MQNVIPAAIEGGRTGHTLKPHHVSPLTTRLRENGMISEQDMGFYTRLAKRLWATSFWAMWHPYNSFFSPPQAV